MLEKIKELIGRNDVCVMATVSEKEPHCSLMSYIADKECREIYMMTLKDSKKYRNLRENNAVSLLIDSREEESGSRGRIKALTVKGAFARIEDEAARRNVWERLLEHHPQLQELEAAGDVEVFAVKIQSVQLLDGVSDAFFETLD
ncbi:MAG: pyridoxamine 5'-phosphate oxidase family protein [Deltaproteobacteria bacterium]|nr:pyridoxamine 5'-phosphate oxidase family protein [Deltaproteobacteria bacterium]